MSPENQIFVAVVQFAVLLFAVSFHESAHGWVALRCGDTTARDLGRISMNPVRHIDLIGSIFLPAFLAISGLPVFGWAKPVPISLRDVPNPRRANLLISAAGPVSNLILAVASAAVLFVLRFVAVTEANRGILQPIQILLFVAVLVNVSLAVFNLLPIPPLDGFGVVESVAPRRFWRVMSWLRRYGFFIFAILVFSGAYRHVTRPAQTWLLGWLGLSF